MLSGDSRGDPTKAHGRVGGAEPTYRESRVLSVDPSVDPSKAHRRVGGAEPTYRPDWVLSRAYTTYSPNPNPNPKRVGLCEALPQRGRACQSARIAPLLPLQAMEIVLDTCRASQVSRTKARGVCVRVQLLVWEVRRRNGASQRLSRWKRKRMDDRALQIAFPTNTLHTYSNTPDTYRCTTSSVSACRRFRSSSSSRLTGGNKQPHPTPSSHLLATAIATLPVPFSRSLLLQYIHPYSGKTTINDGASLIVRLCRRLPYPRPLPPPNLGLLLHCDHLERDNPFRDLSLAQQQESLAAATSDPSRGWRK